MSVLLNYMNTSEMIAWYRDYVSSGAKSFAVVILMHKNIGLMLADNLFDINNLSINMDHWKLQCVSQSVLRFD